MLNEKVKQWKRRLGRLELMTIEMQATPGAELLTALANDAAAKIHRLHMALDKIIAQIGSDPND